VSPFDIRPIADEKAASGRGRTSPLMRAHTITIYNSIGEVDRRAAYTRTVLEGVRVEESSGAVAAMSGASSTDGITVFIPGSTPGFEPPETYAGAGWTLREGDLCVVGTCTSDIPPVAVSEIEATREVYRIKGVKTLRLSGERVHHWEVAGA
jgi:hypothetical protein